MIIIRLAAAALAAALLAGCSTAGVPATSQLSSSAPAAATPVAAPTPQGPPLSVKQAGRLFARIVGPLDRAIGAFQADVTDQPPFSQFQADGRALIAAVRGSEGRLAAARWPAQVQPYIVSLTTSYEPAEIACTQAQISAGSYATAQNANSTNPQCFEANQNDAISAIRAILDLPA